MERLKKGEYWLYSVWNNETNELICFNAEAQDAAIAMCIAPSTFPSVVTRTLQGKLKKWRIERLRASGDRKTKPISRLIFEGKDEDARKRLCIAQHKSYLKRKAEGKIKNLKKS